jgi:hypothetical protein
MTGVATVDLLELEEVVELVWDTVVKAVADESVGFS